MSSRHNYFKNTVNVYMQEDAYLYCVACNLNPLNKRELVYGYIAYNTGDMVIHIKRHTINGDIVDNDLVSRLFADDYYNFPEGGGAGGHFSAFPAHKELTPVNISTFESTH